MIVVEFSNTYHAAPESENWLHTAILSCMQQRSLKQKLSHIQSKVRHRSAVVLAYIVFELQWTALEFMLERIGFDSYAVRSGVKSVAPFWPTVFSMAHELLLFYVQILFSSAASISAAAAALVPIVARQPLKH